MTVLVTGARGDVGGAVLAGLAAAGEPVRASSRAPRPGEFPAGVEVARADLADPASWLAALAGVRKVFLYAHPEGAAEFAAAARKAGVEHVVLLSSSTVLYPDSEANPIAVRHIAAERALEGAGLDRTFVRPGYYATNALRWWQSIRTGRVLRTAFPEAVTSPVHERDIAQVAVRALLDDRHRGAAYPVLGAGPVTVREQVRGARRAGAAGGGGRGDLPRPAAYPAARDDRRARPPGPRERAPAPRRAGFRRGARDPGAPRADIRRMDPRPRSRLPLTA
jgi:uncharacterized protein YbjT (DUF2867 family)